MKMYFEKVIQRIDYFHGIKPAVLEEIYYYGKKEIYNKD